MPSASPPAHAKAHPRSVCPVCLRAYSTEKSPRPPSTTPRSVACGPSCTACAQRAHQTQQASDHSSIDAMQPKLSEARRTPRIDDPKRIADHVCSPGGRRRIQGSHATC
eukprot:9119468-Lingulodinium_polyedra.AAC.1